MNFYTQVIMRDSRFASGLRISDIDLLEPTTRAAIMAICTDARAQGIFLMVFETYRSEARQRAMFAAGATTLQKVGVHHYGLACDLVKNVAGEPSWKGDFSFLGPLAKKHGMIWGGDWGEPPPNHFPDLDHVQRCSIADQARLFDGAWYPGADYNPYMEMNRA